MIAYQLLTDVN